MSAALVNIFLAFGLYTVAIWSEKFLKRLTLWMVFCFAFALLFDAIGTSIMATFSTHSFLETTHGRCGAVALTIMFLHLAWAIGAICGNVAHKAKFTKYSVYAWVVWFATLNKGMFLT